MNDQQQTDEPFTDELPRLLAERGISLRGLARQIGVSDSHLSRAVRQANYKRASPDLIGRIAVALALPRDYFPEYRTAFVVERIKADPSLRNELYARLKRQRPPARRSRD
jgi:transcriptional regulator with XRE-family HTH domain